MEAADTEAQLAVIMAHELSHQLPNDFSFFWKAAKNQEDSFGSGGLLEQSRAIENERFLRERG